MLGNSLTRLKDWTLILNRNDVVNRGISGDRTECICQRLVYLKGNSAKIWFIEGGINDIIGNISVEEIFDNYIQIIDFVKNEKAIPVINLILHIGKGRKDYDYIPINKTIDQLNSKLISYAKENYIDYINLNKYLTDSNGILMDKFTTDGVHLTIDAYTIWSMEIHKILEIHKIAKEDVKSSLVNKISIELGEAAQFSKFCQMDVFGCLS
jgi:lysophospholipase L1-like esterase